MFKKEDAMIKSCKNIPCHSCTSLTDLCYRTCSCSGRKQWVLQVLVCPKIVLTLGTTDPWSKLGSKPKLLYNQVKSYNCVGIMSSFYCFGFVTTVTSLCSSCDDCILPWCFLVKVVRTNMEIWSRGPRITLDALLGLVHQGCEDNMGK